MSIRVVCPNGHVLNVKQSQAGMTGLCPACKARVQVPKPMTSLDDAVADMLEHEPHDEPAPLVEHRADPPVSRHVSPKKKCIRCQQEVDIVAHICPHCHTYIATPFDFRMRT